ncbi:MAG TPA: crosslink repair DNA glycosylase YcaQ family protein [Jatrophihabitantaceae bacterium]|nr:crosslink repair DNA glycosylase YcaQ family protein [Jatrophihabitantaceae bacterium]
MQVTREQVIAYRIGAQQLDRSARSANALAVLDIGVQDFAVHPALLSFDARLAAPPKPSGIGPGTSIALTWSLRGAPHLHRRRDLDALAGALWPLSEQDAAGRLNETGPSVARAGISALDQWLTALDAMRAVVSTPTAKGAASTEVTRRIPKAMRHNCRACKTAHISDSAMRTVALAAGLEIEPNTYPPVLLPRPKARPVDAPDVRALRRLVIAYLTLLGPAAPADVAGYFEVRAADLKQAWPDDLTEVHVDGKKAWLPAAAADQLARARPKDVVRLLGPFDPYLQARDRDVIVPDKAAHKTLWPVLGRPGVLFVDGEVVGAWRPKASGTKLTLTVEAFAPLPESAWRRVDTEAGRVAAVRGATDVTVVRA